MTIKYIGRHERVQNRELLNQISTAIFGAPEDINFAEEFVPHAGKIPSPKVANFAGFLVNGPKHLWAIFSDDNPKIPVGFILIADSPHRNSIGFCIKRNFARKGLMRQAWEEISDRSVKTLLAWHVSLGVFNNSRENKRCRLIENQEQNNGG